MAEHLSGLKVRSLCSDWQIFHPTRKKPKNGGETFSGKMEVASDSTDVEVETEDFGATLFRMGARARGAMTASQASAGRKNGLVMEIYGTKAGVTWRQERPEELWIGHRDAPSQTLLKDPALMLESARSFADVPGGHAEGYQDTFKQLFKRFYASIADPGAPADYPQMADGLRQMNILAAEAESNRRHAWVDVAERGAALAGCFGDLLRCLIGNRAGIAQAALCSAAEGKADVGNRGGRAASWAHIHSGADRALHRGRGSIGPGRHRRAYAGGISHPP